MTEEPKDRWKTFTEEIEVAGSQLVDRISSLLAEGNISRMRIRSRNDDIVLDVPLTAGAVVGGVVVIAAPWLAVLGAIAGLVAHVRIEVVRMEEPEQDSPSDPPSESSDKDPSSSSK
jgi:hypothetical protein